MKIYTHCFFVRHAIINLCMELPLFPVTFFDVRAFPSEAHMWLFAEDYALHYPAHKLFYIFDTGRRHAQRHQADIFFLHDKMVTWRLALYNARLCYFTADRARPLFKVSGRQKEVMALVADGHNIHYISRMLNIATKTVYHHIGALKKQFGVKTINNLYFFLWTNRDCLSVLLSNNQYDIRQVLTQRPVVRKGQQGAVVASAMK